MARVICRLCGKKITVGRTSHLVRAHGIERERGVVREYYLRPEELGLTEADINKVAEGEVIPLYHAPWTEAK